MQTKNKKVLTVIFVFLLISIVVSLLILSNRSSNIKTEPELAGDFLVVSLVDKDNKLYNSFTNNEYLQIKKRLSEFSKSQGGDPVDTVTISQVSRPTRDSLDNIYSFVAYIPSLEGEYKININKPRDASFPAYFEVVDLGYRVNFFDDSDTDNSPSLD